MNPLTLFFTTLIQYLEKSTNFAPKITVQNPKMYYKFFRANDSLPLIQPPKPPVLQPLIPLSGIGGLNPSPSAGNWRTSVVLLLFFPIYRGFKKS